MIIYMITRIKRTAAGKKLLSLLLALVMVLGMLPVTAFAAPNTGDHTEKEKQPVNLHAYIENLDITTAASGVNNIPGFTFETQQTEYDITLIDSTLGKMMLTFSDEAMQTASLGYAIIVNQTQVGKTKAITAKTASIMLAQAASKLNMGDNNIISLRVGTVAGSAITNYDEYIFNVARTPALSGLSISDSTGKLTYSPSFSLDDGYFIDTYTAFTSDETITLNIGFNAAKGVKCFLDDNLSIECSNKINKTITLDDYKVETGRFKIPIHLVYDVAGNTKYDKSFYICISTPDGLIPSILSQTHSFSCEKDTLNTLTVNAVPANEQEELSYQWYRSANSSAFITPIEGATESSYTIPVSETSKANTSYYQCVVTSTLKIDEETTLSFSTRSDPIEVITELSYVSEPVILKELGTFSLDGTNTGGGLPVDNYQTEYKAGEKFAAMYIQTASPEEGTTLSFQYYQNSDPFFPGQSPLKR